MNFLKKYGWIVLLLIMVIGIGSIGYNFLQDIFFQKGMAFAKAENDRIQAEADARIKVNTDFYVDLIGKAEKDRQDVRAVHDAEIRKYKNDIGYFRSETAEALKAKKATAEQWAAEKVKDEIAIGLRDDRIEVQDAQIIKLTEDWRLSDIAKDAAHQKIVNDLILKFRSCQEWSDKLEKKLKPNFWKYAKDAAYIGGAFLLGRASK